MGLPQVTIFKLCSPTELLDLQILLEIGFTFPTCASCCQCDGGAVEGQPFVQSFPSTCSLGNTSPSLLLEERSTQSKACEALAKP